MMERVSAPGIYNRKAPHSVDWVGGIGICQEGKGGRAFGTERQTNPVSFA